MPSEDFCYNYHHLQQSSLLNNLMKPADSLMYYSSLSDDGNGIYPDDSTTSTGTIFKLEDFLNISLDDEEEEEENKENYEQVENESELEGSASVNSPTSNHHSEHRSDKNSSFASPAMVVAASDENVHTTRHLFQQSTQTMPLSSEAVTPIQDCPYSSSTSAIGAHTNHIDDECADDQIGFCSYVDPFADLVMERKPDHLGSTIDVYGENGSNISSPFKRGYQPYYVHRVEFTKNLQLRRKKLDHLMVQLTNSSQTFSSRVNNDVASGSLLSQDEDDATMNNEGDLSGDVGMDDHSLSTNGVCANEYMQMNSDGTLKVSCNADKWNSGADCGSNQRPLQAY